VLVSVLGLAAFSLLLWHDFREPFAFAQVSGVEGAVGTGTPTPNLKIDFYDRLQGTPHVGFIYFYLGAPALFTVVGRGLVPLLFRQLGWDYGAFSAVTTLMPAVPVGRTTGMGRYMLAGFPAAPSPPRRWPAKLTPNRVKRPGLRLRLGAAWDAVNAVGVRFMMSLYARWWLIT